MSDGDAFEFNNTVHGDGAQINQGKQVSATQTNSSAEKVTANRVFDAVAESLAELPEAGREEFEAQVIEPLRLMANLPIAQQQEPSTLEKAQALFERLSPFAPTINKAVLAFGEASLTALASSNPIVSGLLATVKAIKGG